MPIKLGDRTIYKIMLGDRPIKKVMLGDRLVWESYSGNIFKGKTTATNTTLTLKEILKQRQAENEDGID